MLFTHHFELSINILLQVFSQGETVSYIAHEMIAWVQSKEQNPSWNAFAIGGRELNISSY